MIVNVATNCGFTYTNYQQLTELYEKYHHRGLEILAFPCNQFGEQEPGTNEDIQMFAKNFGVTFPVFAKVRGLKDFLDLSGPLHMLWLLTVQLEVNGYNADPLYKFLKNFTDSLELGWNFVKFLVVDGFPVKKYQSRVPPKKIEGDLLQYLDDALDDSEML